MKHSLEFAVTLCIGLVFGCAAPGPRPAFQLPDGNVEQGRQAFEELRCYACHEVDGVGDLPRPTSDPDTGVVLGGLAVREPADAELVTAIIDPSHQLMPGTEDERVTSAGGSRMANYNEVMTVQQLVDLVAFLHSVYDTAGSSGG